MNLPSTHKNKKKILKLYLIHYVKPLSVSTVLNIPAVITAEMFTKGKNPVINSVVYCKTAPAADANFLLFLLSTCLSIPRTSNDYWCRNQSRLVRLLMVLKQPCHDQHKNKSKQLSQNESCSLDIGTQYWTDLHSIALKNNELNVAMADIRH